MIINYLVVCVYKIVNNCAEKFHFFKKKALVCTNQF